MPVVPAPCGGQTWLVFSSSVTAHSGRSSNRCCLRRTARQAAADDPTSIAVCVRGRHPYMVRGGIAWRHLPVEFPSPAVSAVFARWARTAAWPRILDHCATDWGCAPSRSGAPARRSSTRRRCPPPTPRAPIQPRLGWRPDQRGQRHLGVLRTALLGVVVPGATIQGRDAAHRLPAALRGSMSTLPAGLGRRRLPRGCSSGRKTFSPGFTMQIIKRIPGVAGFHVLLRIYLVAGSFAWVNKHRRCVRDCETETDHHEAMVHLAMITTMTSEPGGFQTPLSCASSCGRRRGRRRRVVRGHRSARSPARRR